MTVRRNVFALCAIASLFTISACSGGSGGYGSSGAGNVLPAASQRQVTLSFAGMSALSTARQTQSVSGTTVTLTVNGQVVGTGTLDANGKAVIKLRDDIPAGATVTATAGSTVITFVLAQSAEDTAVMIQQNADGSLTVTTAAGEQPEANPDPNDPDGSTSTEDGHGNTESVNDNDGHSALPANLPIIVTNTCTSITITAKAGQTFSRLRFEENVRDGDGGSKLKFDGPFTSPQTFPLVAQSARIRIELFDASGRQVLDVKASVSAFTAVSGQPTPSPCPSPSPTTAPTAVPTATASPSPAPTKTP